MELPANMMTPTVSLPALDQSNIPLKVHLAQIFTERVKEAFTGLQNVEIIVHDEGISSLLDLRVAKFVSDHTSFSMGSRKEHGASLENSKAYIIILRSPLIEYLSFGNSWHFRACKISGNVSFHST